MANIPSSPSDQRELVRSLDRLRSTIADTPKQYELFFHPGKHLFFTFLKGIVSGLGVLAAIAVVIPLVITMLREVQWVPLIGDFLSSVATRMEEAGNN